MSNIDIKLIIALGKWASELDSAYFFDEADALDDIAGKICNDEDLDEDDSEVLQLLEKNIDDGRFGLNDPDHPTVKAV